MPEVTPPAPEPETPTPAPDAPAPAAPAPAEPKADIKDVTYKGYTFPVNFDMIDDVENVELIDRIENQKSLKATVEFLESMLGKAEYDKLKAHFVKQNGRFKLTELGEVYQTIFEQFDPKG